MNRIWELLHEKETVVLFDVDGTLTSYSYGDYHAHHELDYTPAFRDVNIYADYKRLERSPVSYRHYSRLSSFDHHSSNFSLRDLVRILSG